MRSKDCREQSRQSCGCGERASKQNITAITIFNIANKSKDSVVTQIVTLLYGQDVSFTADHWTSTAEDSYLCCTAHWIDSDWNIQNLVIACDNYFGVDHSGESVARLIRGIWQDYGITEERVALIVTDSAANMNKFGRLLRCPHAYCVAHLLNLTTKLAFDDANIPGGNRVMATARELVGHFRHSTKNTEALFFYQTQDNFSHPIKVSEATYFIKFIFKI
jgi:hypothetical protein